MKKSYFHLSLILIAVLVLFAGCRKDKEFDEDMVVGSWKTSTWSYVFHENHSGSRTQGVVTQNFTWSLSDDELELRVTQYEESESQMVTYVTFVLKSLSGSKMEAYEKNDPGKSTITFTK